MLEQFFTETAPSPGQDFQCSLPKHAFPALIYQVETGEVAELVEHKVVSAGVLLQEEVSNSWPVAAIFLGVCERCGSFRGEPVFVCLKLKLEFEYLLLHQKLWLTLRSRRLVTTLQESVNKVLLIRQLLIALPEGRATVRAVKRHELVNVALVAVRLVEVFELVLEVLAARHGRELRKQEVQ